MKKKSTFSILVFTIFLLLSWVAYADINKNTELMNNESCLSKEFTKDLTNDFDVVIENGIAESDSSKILCDSKNIINRLIRGYAFLKYGKYENPKKNTDETFFDEFSKINPLEFVKKRIKKIVIKSSCLRPTAVAYASKGDDSFYFCGKNILDFDKSSFVNPTTFASTIVHESRHTDQDSVRHVTCTQGPSKGSEGGCDKNRAEKGAYHFEVDSLILIGKYGANFHPATKVNALASGLTLLYTSFNTIPKINTSNNVLLKLQGGEVVSLKDDFSIRSTQYFSRNTLFDAGESVFYEYDTQTYSFTNSWHIYLGAVYIKDKFERQVNVNPGKFGKIIDINYPKTENDVFGAISESTLYYVNSNTTYLNKNIPFIAIRFIKPELCKKEPGVLVLLANDGKSFMFNPKSNSPDFKLIEGCQTRFKNITTLGNNRIALTEDGQLLHLSNNNWIPISATLGQKIEFLSDSFSIYDSLTKLKN